MHQYINYKWTHTVRSYTLNSCLEVLSIEIFLFVSSRVGGLVSILVALCVLTGYSIMTASFVIYEVQEHHTGSKRLQQISGISEPFYWIINFFYDMVLHH